MDSNKRGAKPGKKEQKNENIQVFVRVRPVSAQEKMEKMGKSVSVVECNKEREIIVKERNNLSLTKTFTFDRVFAPDSKQIDVYKVVVNPLIDEVLAGYNCTVFAYGQTGTGKTFTMEGERTSEELSWEKDPQSGIIPRVLNHIFDELRLQQLEFTMGVSYLELYNEELIDLLSPVEDTTKLRLFEDASQKGSLVIQGLQEILVLDKKEVYDIMNKGSQKRQTAATLMNAQSSRSHTIFTVTVHIRESNDDGEELLRTGKINLVDLAGSENIGRSGAKQQRAREAGNINQSLLTLGRVITALVERTPHIPYRESKLTRLLQDSLGGRTKTSIIATVSPVQANIEETLSTLDYAHRAKSITNRPEINQRLTKKALLKEYTTEIERLRRDLEATRDGTGVFLAHDNYVQMMARLDSQDGELGDNIQRIRALEEEREKKEIICDRLNMELEKKTQELEETTQNLQMTQSNLVATREDLHNTEEQRDETQELLLNHVVTEKELGAQAVQLLKVADASTTDLHRVHDKLDRKRSVERQNAESVQQFLEKFTHQVAHMKESSQLHSEEQAQQLTEISKQLGAALESFHTIETACQTRAAAFLESHTHNLQVFEKELRSQAEAQQQWSSSQIQFEREHVSAQVSALQATHAQAQATMQTLTEAVNQLGNVFSTAIQSAIQQIDKQSHRVQSQTLKQVEQIATMNQHMLSFTQQVSDNLQQYRDELNAMKEHDNNIFQMEEEERKYFAEMIKSMHLFQEKQNSRKSKQDEKSKYYGNMADIIDKQETVNKESSAVYEKQLIDIDEQSSILLSEHTQFSKDLSKSMKSMSSEMNDRFDGLINQHKAVCSDISNLETMVEKGWQTHSDTLEQQLRQHAEAAQDDLQVQTSQLQNLKTLMVQQTEDQSAFADAREKSLGEHMVASQAVIREHSTTAEEWSEQHSRELLERSQDVHAFLTQGIKCDQPTGATPQRRTLDFPRTLKATSPHERILERFRAARVKQRLPTKCHSVDSVIAASSSDEASLSRSTSASSLSSPEDRIMVDKENTSDTLIINKDSLKVNQKSPLLNRKIQSNQSLKSKRKVLTNQN